MTIADVIDLTKSDDYGDFDSMKQLDSMQAKDDSWSDSDDSLIDKQMSRYRNSVSYVQACMYFVLLYSEFSDCYIEYLNGDVALPIFSRQSRQRTSSLHTVRSILDSSDDIICSKHPIQIDTNCTFIVDSTKLSDPGDVKCDDCGAWRQTKTATTNLQIIFF